MVDAMHGGGSSSQPKNKWFIIGGISLFVLVVATCVVLLLANLPSALNTTNQAKSAAAKKIKKATARPVPDAVLRMINSEWISYNENSPDWVIPEGGDLLEKTEISWDSEYNDANHLIIVGDFEYLPEHKIMTKTLTVEVWPEGTIIGLPNTH